MLGTSVELQAGQSGAADGVLGQHALDGQLHGELGALLHEQAFDLVSIKEKATAAGMSLPSDSQVYYIDLSDPDNAVVYEQESGGAAKVLEEIWQSILRTVEYFR